MIRIKVLGDWIQVDDGEWAGSNATLVALAESISRAAHDGRYIVDRDREYASEVANALRPQEIDLSQHTPTLSAAGVIY